MGKALMKVRVDTTMCVRRSVTIFLMMTVQIPNLFTLLLNN